MELTVEPFLLPQQRKCNSDIKCQNICPRNSSLCLSCTGNQDKYFNPYYSCKLCSQDREYLKQTDHLFRFVGYSSESMIDIEYQECQQCKHWVAFSPRWFGILRDRFHAYARKRHLEVCVGSMSGKCYLG